MGPKTLLKIIKTSPYYHLYLEILSQVSISMLKRLDKHPAKKIKFKFYCDFVFRTKLALRLVCNCNCYISKTNFMICVTSILLHLLTSLIDSSIATIPQMDHRRPLELVNEETSTVLDLNVRFVVTAFVMPMKADRSISYPFSCLGVSSVQPSRSLSTTPHCINTFSWHGNACRAIKAIPRVVYHFIR